MTYQKAPITEAVFDIKVPLKPGLSTEQLKNFQPEGYPKRKEQVELSGSVQVGAQQEVSTSTKQFHIGFMLSSPDSKQIVQARLDGFTFSRLAPYESWDPFFEEAKRLWKLYTAAADPIEISRIAVRYINRIDIPESSDLGEYLTTRPEVAEKMQFQAMDQFFMQMQIPQSDINAYLALHEARVPPQQDGGVSILLDIDLFKIEKLSLEEDLLWAQFGELRKRKNEIFEACITDKTRRLFD